MLFDNIYIYIKACLRWFGKVGNDTSKLTCRSIRFTMLFDKIYIYIFEMVCSEYSCECFPIVTVRIFSYVTVFRINERCHESPEKIGQVGPVYF